MYCPKCGTPNEEKTRYCRGCGEDLRVVFQALEKPLSFVVAHKIDDVLKAKRNNLFKYEWLKNQKKRAAGEVLSGVSALLALIWFVVLEKGNPGFLYGMIAAIACYLIVIGCWDYRKAQRLSSSGEDLQAAEPEGGSSTKELSAPGAAALMMPLSVAENTTANQKTLFRKVSR